MMSRPSRREVETALEELADAGAVEPDRLPILPLATLLSADPDAVEEVDNHPSVVRVDGDLYRYRHPRPVKINDD